MLIFILVVLIIICLCTLKTGGKEEIEYLNVKFPVEKYVKKACPSINIYLPNYCLDVNITAGRELPDFSDSIKALVTLETYRQEFSTGLLPFSEFACYYYAIAEVLTEKKYPEIIIIGTYAGIVPLAVAEAFGCKIHYFTIKPLVKQIKDNKLIEVYRRFPNEEDFTTLHGLPLFNYALFYSTSGELFDWVNSELFTFAYAYKILKSFQPLFSQTLLHGSFLESRPAYVLPEGKILTIPFMYHRGGCYMLETKGKLRETIYNFTDIARRLFVYTCCIRTQGFDERRVANIPDYPKLKKVAEKYIGKMLCLGEVKREEFMQKAACYQKKYMFPAGKLVLRVIEEPDFIYSLYIDAMWYQMPKMKYVPFDLLHTVWVLEQFIIFRNEKKQTETNIVNVFVLERYKYIFFLGFFDAVEEYVYLIKDESEIYLCQLRSPKLRFYMLQSVSKHLDLLQQRNFVNCKSENEFRKIAAEKKYNIIEDDFYRPELVESCAVMLQTIWRKSYPYRCFIPESRMLQEILNTAFKDAVINHGSILDGDFLFED